MVLSTSRLANAHVETMLPAADVGRAVAFYRDKLGFDVQTRGDMPGYATVRFPDGGSLGLYVTAPTKAEHTVINFNVDDLDATMKELRSRGVSFEDYDLPNVKTVDQVASFGPVRTAWCVDSEGNVLAVSEIRE